jgi:hypothetical protein
MRDDAPQFGGEIEEASVIDYGVSDFGLAERLAGL